jgi:ion channel POLLUX/CASTOR
LGQRPGIQLVAVLGAVLALALIFGAICALFGGARDDDRTLGSGVWWAITRMLDGGTVASDSGIVRRVFGVIVTLFGLVSVVILTGAFATSFADRIQSLRRGTNPIFERGHMLFLGWSERGGVIARELAVTMMKATIVILTREDREVVEERLRDALGQRKHGLRLIVRRGDPTTTAAVRRAAARDASVVMILPEASPGPEADRVALRSLLALRRSARASRVPAILEVTSRSGRELVRLIAKPTDAIVVEARDVNARVLAHAVRQPGAFEVVRQILSLDVRSFFAHSAAPFASRTFDEAHAAIDNGVLAGVTRRGVMTLCPDGGFILERDDQLVVFSDLELDPSTSGSLPVIDASPIPIPPPTAALELLVVRYKPELASLLGFIDERRRAAVTVLVAPEDLNAARAALDAAKLNQTEVEIVAGDPLDGAVIARLLARTRDAVLLLAPDVPSSDIADADADQVITLLHVRAKEAAIRVVVEVRSPETKRVAAGLNDDGDFILSREMVGMLLAQELYVMCRANHQCPWLGSVYHEILHAASAEVRLRPMPFYAEGNSRPSFALLSASARARGEIAIGVVEEGARPNLLPRRDQRFAATDEARVVVITKAVGQSARAAEGAPAPRPKKRKPRRAEAAS